jgi:pimeloyl-ACP methyl ester carboxylesterase
MLIRMAIAIPCLLAVFLTSVATLAAGPEVAGVQRHITIGERELVVWTWLPRQHPARGVILFSHGFASAPWKYEQLIGPWVKSGYQVEAPLHVDSTDHPRREDFPGLAAWTARIEDMRALSEELGGASYVAAGHSFGALTALALGGAEAFVPEEITAPIADVAVSVVLAFSPPPPVDGLISEEGYSSLSRPALIQTGTLDVPMGADYPWEKHLDAFRMAKAGGHRYALVLAGVDHYFGGGICRPELPGPQQLAELEVASRLSILMIQAHAEHDADALAQLKASLQSEGPTVLLYK